MEDAIIAMEAEVEKVRKKFHKTKSITFSMFAPIYLEMYAKGKKDSWKTDEKFINSRLLPYFGDMQLSEITSEHVSEFISQFKPKKGYIEKVKGSTVNKHLQVLSRIFNVAEEFGYEVGKNPVNRKIHFAKETKYRRTRILNHKEESRLIQACSPHLKPIIQCALLQALRLKEILQMRISDVDLQEGTITIRPESSKNDKLETIPLRPRMRLILMQLIAENGGRTPYVFNYLDSRTGEYRPIKSIQHGFRAACRRAKIKDLQFRDLRRTCATRLHEAEVDPLIVSRLLRHSSTKISSEVYILSNLRLMKKALNEVDKEPLKKPNSRPDWNIFRTRDDTAEEPEKVRCLFSMN